MDELGIAKTDDRQRAMGMFGNCIKQSEERKQDHEARFRNALKERVGVLVAKVLGLGTAPSDQDLAVFEKLAEQMIKAAIPEDEVANARATLHTYTANSQDPEYLSTGSWANSQAALDSLRRGDSVSDYTIMNRFAQTMRIKAHIYKEDCDEVIMAFDRLCNVGGEDGELFLMLRKQVNLICIHKYDMPVVGESERDWTERNNGEWYRAQIIGVAFEKIFEVLNCDRGVELKELVGVYKDSSQQIKELWAERSGVTIQADEREYLPHPLTDGEKARLNNTQSRRGWNEAEAAVKGVRFGKYPPDWNEWMGIWHTDEYVPDPLTEGEKARLLISYEEGHEAWNEAVAAIQGMRYGKYPPDWNDWKWIRKELAAYPASETKFDGLKDVKLGLGMVTKYHQSVRGYDTSLYEEALEHVPKEHPFHVELAKRGSNSHAKKVPNMFSARTALMAFGSYIEDTITSIIQDKIGQPSVKWARLFEIGFEPINMDGTSWSPTSRVFPKPDAIRCMHVKEFIFTLVPATYRPKIPTSREFLESCMIHGAKMLDERVDRIKAMDGDLVKAQVERARDAELARLTLEDEESEREALRLYRASSAYKEDQHARNQKARDKEKANKAIKAAALKEKENEKARKLETERLAAKKAQADECIANGIKYAQQLWDTNDRKAARERLGVANKKHFTNASTEAQQHSRDKRAEWDNIEAAERLEAITANDTPHVSSPEPSPYVSEVEGSPRESQSQRKARRKREKAKARAEVLCQHALASQRAEEERIKREREEGEEEARRQEDERRARVHAEEQRQREEQQRILDDDDDTCIICMDRKRTHTTVPCGHFKFCGDCAAKMTKEGRQKCPECNVTLNPAQKFMKVFTK